MGDGSERKRHLYRGDLRVVRLRPILSVLHVNSESRAGILPRMSGKTEEEYYLFEVDDNGEEVKKLF